MEIETNNFTQIELSQDVHGKVRFDIVVKQEDASKCKQLLQDAITTARQAIKDAGLKEASDEGEESNEREESEARQRARVQKATKSTSQ